MQRILVGSYILKFETLASTNDFCKELYKEKGAGALTAAVITNEQTKGRGQRGNTWLAKKGENLTFSAICDTSFLSINDVFYLNKAVSLAIVRCLHEFNVFTTIKWPNDLLVNNHKIGGILIESTIQSTHLSYSIIGIGLNVNETNFNSSLKATSIKEQTGKDVNLDSIFERILDYLDQSLWVLKQNLKGLDIEYFQNLFGLNENLVFEDKNGVFSGKIVDVSTNGQLHIETSEGIRYYNFKEVKFLL